MKNPLMLHPGTGGIRIRIEELAMGISQVPSCRYIHKIGFPAKILIFHFSKLAFKKLDLFIYTNQQSVISYKYGILLSRISIFVFMAFSILSNGDISWNENSPFNNPNPVTKV